MTIDEDRFVPDPAHGYARHALYGGLSSQDDLRHKGWLTALRERNARRTIDTFGQKARLGIGSGTGRVKHERFNAGWCEAGTCFKCTGRARRTRSAWDGRMSHARRAMHADRVGRVRRALSRNVAMSQFDVMTAAHRSWPRFPIARQRRCSRQPNRQNQDQQNGDQECGQAKHRCDCPGKNERMLGLPIAGRSRYASTLRRPLLADPLKRTGSRKCSHHDSRERSIRWSAFAEQSATHTSRLAPPRKSGFHCVSVRPRPLDEDQAGQV